MLKSRTFIAAALIGSVLTACVQQSLPNFKSLPAQFVADRIFVVPKTLSGEKISFYTDTGGGWNAIRKSEAERLELKTQAQTSGESGTLALVDFPSFSDEAAIPKPSERYWQQGRLVVVEDERMSHAGFLGGKWFADKVWDFNYLERTLAYSNGAVQPTSEFAVTLGFQTNSEGMRTNHFPRMPVRVGTHEYQMLFDTGATAKLSAEIAQLTGLEKGAQVGTSYIRAEVFDLWERENPDWLVVENAEVVTGQAFDMIRVPEISVAGLVVGPVWFAQRPDATFSDWMSSMMDQPIDGAIGGSALKYFRVIVDYPHSRAYFSVDSGSQ